MPIVMSGYFSLAIKVRIDFGSLPDSAKFFGNIDLSPEKKIALYISERNWYEDQVIAMNEYGSVWLEFSTDNEQKLLSCIIQFCDDVKVLEPVELREKVKCCAKRIAGYYK